MCRFQCKVCISRCEGNIAQADVDLHLYFEMMSSNVILLFPTPVLRTLLFRLVLSIAELEELTA